MFWQKRNLEKSIFYIQDWEHLLIKPASCEHLQSWDTAITATWDGPEVSEVNCNPKFLPTAKDGSWWVVRTGWMLDFAPASRSSWPYIESSSAKLNLRKFKYCFQPFHPIWISWLIVIVRDPNASISICLRQMSSSCRSYCFLSCLVAHN